jgi:antitoxin CptB
VKYLHQRVALYQAKAPGLHPVVVAQDYSRPAVVAAQFGYNRTLSKASRVFVVERNRLFWGSRRGMLELDLVLLPFLENIYPGLEQADKERYWKLLECEDQDMFAWFLRREDPEDLELKGIVDIIRRNTGLQPDA